MEDEADINWGYYLYGKGPVKVYNPGKTPRIMERYTASVILRWSWHTDRLWVSKNRYGRNNCWLDECDYISYAHG